MAHQLHWYCLIQAMVISQISPPFFCFCSSTVYFHMGNQWSSEKVNVNQIMSHFPALISLTLSSPLYTLKLNLLTRVHRPFFDPCFFVRPHLLSLSPALLSSFLVFLWKTQFQPCLRVFKLAITSPWIYCSSNVRMACCHFSDCPFLRNGFLWQPLHCHFLLSLLQSFLTLHYLPLV